MKRGEIWTLQDRNYASKARPVVVIQSDKHDSFDSVILCLFTSFESGGYQHTGSCRTDGRERIAKEKLCDDR